MAENINSNPRPWGAGNHLSQTDMDDLEVRKVRALERIADALDGRKTSLASGVSSSPEPRAKQSSGAGRSSLFDCFKI